MSGYKVCKTNTFHRKTHRSQVHLLISPGPTWSAKKKCRRCLVGWDWSQMWWSKNAGISRFASNSFIVAMEKSYQTFMKCLKAGKIGMFHCYLVTTLMQQSMMAMYVHLDFGILSHLDVTWCVYLRVQIYMIYIYTHKYHIRIICVHIYTWLCMISAPLVSNLGHPNFTNSTKVQPSQVAVGNSEASDIFWTKRSVPPSSPLGPWPHAPIRFQELQQKMVAKGACVMGFDETTVTNIPHRWGT